MDVSFIMPFDNICLVPYSLDNLSEKNRLPPTLGKPNSRDPIQSTKLHDNLSVWGCNPVRSPPKSSSSRKWKPNYSSGFSKGHLISKELIGVIVFYQRDFLRISALASKKSTNQ